ncbi:MAG: hypothetical protein A2V78_15990 [Betaproteobacteria bacterium RBG_16_64_18]|nr:MAG: hypothetical protein A2V78_15990 [Betaproteobacteria bacterium RBG_16_64_18]
MARGTRKAKVDKSGPQQSGLVALTKELWQAAVTLRGSIEPADYKRYVLPLIFLRFLSIRYEDRRAELEQLIADRKSDYHGDKSVLEDPDEYVAAGALIVPPEARWDHIAGAIARRDDVKVRMDEVLRLLEDRYPDKLRGLLPPIYAGSNLDPESLRGLINLFSKDVFRPDHGGDDVIGRVYEYFIGEFASSEGKRGGEYFTPASIVKTLVAMLEPTEGIVFDPCCGSGGMFVQSDVFTRHSGKLSFRGQEGKDFTFYREFKRAGRPAEEPGFCRVATLDEIGEHRYVLTPGRYVGSANGEEDDTPFEERFPKLVTELEAQFAESDKLQKEIRTQRARVTGALKNGKA